MKNDNIIYTLSLKKDLKDDKELYEFIRKSFPEIEVTPSKSSYFSFVFSFFAHVCYPLTVSELASATGTFIKSNTNKIKIKRLVDRGLLKSCRFPVSDGGAKVAYYLSGQGVEYLMSLLPSYLFSKGKIRRTKGIVPLHDYGLGISLLQCMLLETPFTYFKEQCYSSTLYKEKGTLCVDAVVYFKDIKQTTLYIEQDMGTESTSVLVGKLDNYNKFGLVSSPNNHLIISSHSSCDYTSCLSFNITALNSLISDMEVKEIGNVYEYFITQRNEIDNRLLLTVMAFMVRVGICVSYNNNRKEVSAEEITTGSRLSRNESVSDFTRGDLSFYIDSLVNGSNEYRVVDFNKRQSKYARNKLCNMADLIFRKLSLGCNDIPEIQFLLNGFSCFVVPSVIMSNYFDFMFNEHTSIIRTLLSPYYPGIDGVPFEELSKPLSFLDYPTFKLRNCFSFPDGRLVCVENISIDLGGYVRGYYLRTLMAAGVHAAIHMICICNSEEEAMEYARVLNYYRAGRDLEENDIMFSFILSSDIKQGRGALKVSSRLGGGGLVNVKGNLNGSANNSSETSDLEGLSMSELVKLLG